MGCNNVTSHLLKMNLGPTERLGPKRIYPWIEVYDYNNNKANYEDYRTDSQDDQNLTLASLELLSPTETIVDDVCVETLSACRIAITLTV